MDLEELEALSREWMFSARPEQLPPPGDWTTWLIQTGRGWGKTRTGSEAVIEAVRSGAAKRVHLVARSAADARDVMVEGESGIMSSSPPDFRPEYEPSKRRLTWPNGATATTFSADKHDQLRGPQCDMAWADELAAWRYPAAWDQLLFGLRLGALPRVIVTTTPRPRRFLRDLASQASTVVTRGSTRDNAANLSPVFMRQIFEKYGSTHLGRQELGGELLDELPGALFTRASIEDGRVERAPELSRIVVAIDPAVTSGEASNESGIVAVGMSADLDFYVLEDASMIATPDAVIRKALELLRRHNADSLVVEKNQGGDLWSTIVNQLDPTVAVHLVHASRGKATRAEPVAARYEQGRVKHVGIFPALEDQLTCFVPGVDEGADDRLDALVWGVTELDTRSQPEITMDISINHAGKGLPWL